VDSGNKLTQVVIADNMAALCEPEWDIRDWIGAIWREERNHTHRAVNVFPYGVVVGRSLHGIKNERKMYAV
jgi:hypothetical protein